MTWIAASAVEPVSKAMLEGLAYNNYSAVAGGCAITFSGANMTFNIGDGAVWVNGAYKAVTAQSNVAGLVADATYSTWEYIVVNGSGTCSVIAGTAAANPAEPTIDYATYTTIYAVLVPANQTIANTITTKYDKRVPTLYQSPQMNADFTKTSNTTFADVPLLKFYMETAGTYAWELLARSDIAATPGIKVGFTVPASATASGQGTLFTTAAVVADAQDDIISGHATHVVLVPGATGIRIHLSGTCVSGGTAGFAQLQAAQSVSNGSATTLVALGSRFTVWRIA